MPYISIELIEGRTENQKAAIAKAVTEALVVHGGAKVADVDIVFTDVAPGNWAIAGQLMSHRSTPETT